LSSGIGPCAKAWKWCSPLAPVSPPALTPRATGACERKLALLVRVPLLIIDDFGFRPLRPTPYEDLHDLISER
jgi:hypothetical protein